MLIDTSLLEIDPRGINNVCDDLLVDVSHLCVRHLDGLCGRALVGFVVAAIPRYRHLYDQYGTLVGYSWTIRTLLIHLRERLWGIGDGGRAVRLIVGTSWKMLRCSVATNSPLPVHECIFEALQTTR